ncbi:MAG TPA: ClpXP protease specificity-enhancing factor SspB [Pseudolabrys sp.]|nr:ClpXP protease specificity-enhancing factor SspB [Pseudolabrys sp.]
MDHIRYDLLTQQALRGVVRTVLADAAANGLPGEHHFYIAFDTRAEGVGMPDRLRAQYPEQMTIILQHQFWDLKVSDEGFEVGLSFGGIPTKLSIPFQAVKGFFDPSVQFGLQFEEVGEAEAQRTAPANASEKGASTPAPAPTPIAGPAAAPAEATTDDPDKEPPAGGSAEVVRLDRFRKK